MTAAALRLILAGRRLRKEIVTTDCGALIDRPEHGEAAAQEFDAAYEAWKQGLPRRQRVSPGR